MLVPIGKRGCLSVAGQHPLGAVDSLAEAVLKRIVLLALLDMASDSCTDDLGNWLAIDSGDHVQFLRLVSRQANRHCLHTFHSQILGHGIVVVNALGGMVSCNH